MALQYNTLYIICSCALDAPYNYYNILIKSWTLLLSQLYNQQGQKYHCLRMQVSLSKGLIYVLYGVSQGQDPHL